MRYTSGNYEAFARPRKPAGVEQKSAWFVGAGLASLSGALADALRERGVALSGLAQGVPIGGELDYLDDGTISAALRARRAL